MVVGKRGRKKFRPLLEWRIVHPSPRSPWIDNLPTDVTANILHRLGAVEILKIARKVCATWRTVCDDPAMWRVIHMKPCPGFVYRRLFDLDRLCRLAVDLSQGQLTDITIERFAMNDLLLHISDRSCRLKCLTLVCCDHISRGDLTRAVTKFPELEELHLILTPHWIDAEDIKIIGISCPMLKSFAFKSPVYRFGSVDNSCALAIAKNMPNLRHLGLFGNVLRDEGVKAILDGCPHLESLDLRRCCRVELLGDLDTRCSERIKDLRRPSDSFADYEYYDEYSYDDSYSFYSLENYYDHIDDDNGDDDDLYDSTYSVDHYFGGYEKSDDHIDADQVELNYWDATDRSKKGKIVSLQLSRRCSERM